MRDKTQKRLIETLARCIDGYCYMLIEHPEQTRRLYHYCQVWGHLTMYFRYLKYYNIDINFNNYNIPNYLVDLIRDEYDRTYIFNTYKSRKGRQHFHDAKDMLKDSTLTSFYHKCHEELEKFNNESLVD